MKAGADKSTPGNDNVTTMHSNCAWHARMHTFEIHLYTALIFLLETYLLNN